MRSKLRHKPARVSFLAFQDMISTVTGVLLIVMLMLSLDVSALAPRANESARDALRDQLQQARQRLEASRQALSQRQAELAALQHRVFVIPEPDRSGKEPVLIVLSATNGCCTWLNRTNVLEFSAGAGTTRSPPSSAERGDRAVPAPSQPGQLPEFEAFLRSWDAARVRLVFYVRPSGIAHFERCRSLARAGGFEIGYDAAEEDRQYVLLSP